MNPEKCMFGIEAGKFLGFLLTERGIEENPERCAVMRRVVVLSGFVSAGGDKGHSYFQCVWTHCKEAFIRLKEDLDSPPILCKLQPSTPLCLYFAVTDQAISPVLIQEQDQFRKPICFESKVWQGLEVRYQVLEKAALAVPCQLSPMWTGPFKVTKVLRNKAYRLETLEGGAIPRTWNAVNFKFNFS